jgi:hypothetical protein
VHPFAADQRIEFVRPKGLMIRPSSFPRHLALLPSQKFGELMTLLVVGSVADDVVTHLGSWYGWGIWIENDVRKGTLASLGVD